MTPKICFGLDNMPRFVMFYKSRLQTGFWTCIIHLSYNKNLKFISNFITKILKQKNRNQENHALLMEDNLKLGNLLT